MANEEKINQLLNSTMSAVNLQEEFLAQLQRERRPVTIIMANGHQMRGTITGADQFTIQVESGGKRQLVYKSALSTIVGEAGT